MSVKSSRRWMRVGDKSAYLRFADRGYEPKPDATDLVAEGLIDYEDELEDLDLASCVLADSCRAADWMDGLPAVALKKTGIFFSEAREKGSVL